MSIESTMVPDADWILKLIDIRVQSVIPILDKVNPGNPIQGIEVGVWKGDFSFRLLAACSRISILYGIDPYSPCQWGMPWGSKDWDFLYLGVVQKMIMLGPRFTLIRDKSSVVLPLFPPMDFIFIDGDHSFDSTIADIRGAEAILKPGGALFGHDYGSKKDREVKSAVDKYAKDHGRQVGVIPETVWWWIKP